MSTDAPTATRVLLIRHGDSWYETDGSGDSGGSLSVDGRDQARRLGLRLHAFAPATVICSELSRAVQTAEIAAAVVGVPVEVRVGLQEYDVGDERGHPYNANVFEPLLAHWLAGGLSAQIPGGEDGHAVAQRMFTVLDAAAERHIGGTVAAISHGGSIISVLGGIAPGGLHLPVGPNDMPGCDLYVLDKSESRWRLTGRERD